MPPALYTEQSRTLDQIKKDVFRAELGLLRKPQPTVIVEGTIPPLVTAKKKRVR